MPRPSQLVSRTEAKVAAKASSPATASARTGVPVRSRSDPSKRAAIPLPRPREAIGGGRVALEGILRGLARGCAAWLLDHARASGRGHVRAQRLEAPGADRGARAL